jgi:predicted dithiol-disulfide oxidoreductase (DUF899 family)
MTANPDTTTKVPGTKLTVAEAPHTVGTRDEWRAARVRLLEAEKELTRRSDELARQRRELPWVPVETGYVFDTEDGPATLADLFRGRSQLIVQHFMFPPSWDAGCPSCSSMADGWAGSRAHLENHDVAITAISRAPLAKLLAYRDRMGWDIPWASSAGTTFNVDFGVSFTERQLAEGAEYNFRPIDWVEAAHLPHGGDSGEYVDDGESPGISAFVLDGGRVFHTYSAYSRGVDAVWGMYQWFDRAPLGRNEDGMWFRRHDEYEGVTTGASGPGPSVVSSGQLARDDLSRDDTAEG